MKEMMSKTVAACLAVIAMASGTYVIGSGVKSIASESVVSMVSEMEARRLAIEKSITEAEEGSESLVQSLKKFGRITLPK